MKKSKKFIVFLFIFCIMFGFSACGKIKADEFISLQKFEYHFYPEEYEEEFNELQKTFTLEADTEYQFQVNAACESGTIVISIDCKNEESKEYLVDSSAPCTETISFPANTTDTVYFVITIQPDTKGDVVGELLTR